MKNAFSFVKSWTCFAAALVLCLLVIGARPGAAQTPTTLTTEHVDLAFNYAGGVWDLAVQDKTNNIFYTPANAVLQANAGAKKNRPAGTQWDFLGVSSGQPVWILPFTRNTSLLYLGTNSEGTTSGTFDSYDASTASGGRVAGSAPWIKVSLISVSGPGYFSVWTTGSFGTPTVWMASANGVNSDDALWIYEGSHIHFNWGFTQAGTYQVTLRASGYIGGIAVDSSDKIYTFVVKP